MAVDLGKVEWYCVGQCLNQLVGGGVNDSGMLSGECQQGCGAVVFHIWSVYHSLLLIHSV